MASSLSAVWQASAAISLSMSGKAALRFAAVLRRLALWYRQIRFSSSTVKYIPHTSISFDFSRAGGLFFCSSLAAASCARMDGFFYFCVVFRVCLGFLASALAASATSKREICSPAFALASSSSIDGALFIMPSIML